MRFTTAASVAFVLAATALSTTDAHAQRNYGWDMFWHNVGVSAKRMNHYPEPFIYADRDATRHPFRIMVHNGWRLQNTLGDHYFHPETQELTRSGELKVRSIVTQSPEQFRTVYVLRGRNADVTSIRVDAVQQMLARTIRSGPLPQVVESGSAPRGTPGDYVDSTLRSAESGRPAAVLPASNGDSN